MKARTSATAAASSPGSARSARRETSAAAPEKRGERGSGGEGDTVEYVQSNTYLPCPRQDMLETSYANLNENMIGTVLRCINLGSKSKPGKMIEMCPLSLLSSSTQPRSCPKKCALASWHTDPPSQRFVRSVGPATVVSAERARQSSKSAGPSGVRERDRTPGRAAATRRQRASVGKISAKCCSFSAVSAPIFARKYAFCSIFQNLPDSQAEIFEI